MNIEELKEIVAGATKGKWTLYEKEKWPFDLEVLAESAESPEAQQRVIGSSRFAYGSSDNTLEDVMAGAAFKTGHREDAVRMNAEQLANHRLIALAPELAARVIAADELVKALRECYAVTENEKSTLDDMVMADERVEEALSAYEAL